MNVIKSGTPGMHQQHQISDESIRQKPCIHCEGTDYTWANVTYFGHKDKEGNVQLRENNPSLRPSRATEVGWTPFLRQPLLARRCNTCGNVQLFTSEGGRDGQKKSIS